MFRHAGAVKLAVVLTLFSALCAAAAYAQTKGTFAAGIDYSAGPPILASNTGYLFGGISPVQTLTTDSKGKPLDFNGDGKVDVVAAANCTSAGSGSSGIANCPPNGSAIGVYLGNGDGTFKPAIVNAGPAEVIRSIAVGDFNGDGKTDIVAASDCLSDQDCSSGAMVILLGNGDGTFSSSAPIPINGIVSQSNTLAVGDFNLDGKMDIVVGIACYNISINGCNVGAVSVYPGLGNGTFGPPVVNNTVGNYALYPVVGDFNGDGKPDIIAGDLYAPNDNSHSSLTVLLGAGDGTFSQTVTILPFYGLVGLAAADFNSDGKLDLAVISYASPNEIFVGNGDGTFQTPIDLRPGPLPLSYPQSLAVGDVNGDGKPDLLIAGTIGGFNGTQIFLNDGTGNLVAGNYFNGGGWEYTSLGVADFNNDGKNDVLLVSECAQYPGIYNNCLDGTLSVVLGNGDGSVSSAYYLDPGNSVGISTFGASVAAADFNGDGFQDLVYPACSTPNSECNSAGGFALLIADGSGGYRAPVLFTAPVSGPRYVTVGDFNGDGKPDVAVFNDSDASGTASSVSIFINTGNGTFSPPNAYESGGQGGIAIASGDFNGDGKLDIALLHSSQSNTGSGLLGILLGNGDGTFQPVITSDVASGAPVFGLSVADFNGDGRSDIVLAADTYDSQTTLSLGTAEVLLSNGDGTFAVRGNYYSGGDRYLGGYGRSVATGDINGDGRVDVIIGNVCEPMRQSGGYCDLNCGNGSIGVLLGNGDGTFQYAPTQVVQDGNLWAIALADVDADGKLDAIASTSTGVAVARGNGDGTFQQPTIYATVQVAQNIQMAIADLNGDGGLDIVQPETYGQRFAVLYNQGFGKVASLTTLQSSVNPSVSGKSVTFTATVASSAGVPTGKVTFNSGSTVLGTATLKNGVAKGSTSKLPAGANSITAVYSGDSKNNGSTSAVLSQFVLEATTSSLTSSPNPSAFGQAVSFTATVASGLGAPPDGEVVTFKNGATVLGTAPLIGGTAALSVSTLGVGNKSVTEVYGGDSNFAGSTSKAVVQSVARAGTTTSVVSSLNPSTHGQSVTFTATVRSAFGGTPAGSVTFVDGSTTLRTVAIRGGVATFSTAKLSVGSHSITARYNGGGNFNGSSGQVAQTVN